MVPRCGGRVVCQENDMGPGRDVVWGSTVRKGKTYEPGDKTNVSEIFERTFNDTVMQRLLKKVYKDLKHAILEGKELSPEMADVIAHEMKE